MNLDVIIVIQASQKNEIMQTVNALSDIKLQIREELIQPSNLDNGTADALLQVIKNHEIKVIIDSFHMCCFSR